jgi:hypothetical protein
MKKQMKHELSTNGESKVELSRLRLLIEFLQLKLNGNSGNISNKSLLLKVLIENLNYIFEKQQETQDSDESYEYIQLSLLRFNIRDL